MNRGRFGAPASAWDLIHVDPGRLDRYGSVSLEWGLGRVRGGEWDRTDREPLSETDVYTGLKERFVDGLPWTETAYCEWGREGLADAESFRGFADIEEFVEYRCRAVDELVASIRADGYRPNYGRLYDSAAEIEYVNWMEPIVCVGRDGDLLATEGYHRIVLAQLLGVDSIPVRVLRRHESWQAVRDAVARGEPIPVDGVTPSHPDLRDVHPDARGESPTVVDVD
ncbi:MAG: hypothetical protein ACOCRD_05080 [Halorubrum sp.]